MMKKIVLVWVSFLLLGSTVAADRDLEGIDLVTRAERSADETMRLDVHPWYLWWKQNTDSFDQRLATGGQTGNPEFEKEVISRQKYTVSNQRLMNQYPNDIDVQEFALDKRGFSLDQITKQEGGEELRWPLTYKQEKKKIVIHHTVGVSATSLEEGKEVMQDLQVQHGFSNGRGDIGYHFLIDSAGTIYEGRAGGEGVIGAHMKWNNTSSIGIAMMGNFEESVPTTKMKESLLRLVTSLSRKYDIDPTAKTQLFRVDDASPYLYASVHDSVVGHQDGSATECPGDHLAKYIEPLKSQSSSLLKYFGEQGVVDFDAVVLHSEDIVGYSADDTISVSFPYSGGEEVTCELSNDSLVLLSCEKEDDMLVVELERTGYQASGRMPLLVSGTDSIQVYSLVLVWQQDIQQLLGFRKQIHADTYGDIQVIPQIRKITKPVAFDTIKEHVKKNVSVLLYELSTSFTEWNMLCEQGCTVKTDDSTYINASAVDVIAYADRIDLVIDGSPTSTEYLIIKNKGIVTFENYGRASFAGIPWNSFRGDIIIQRERMRHLQNGRVDAWTVVNDLSFDDYLKGIVESNDQDSLEKVKAIYLAVKNYTAHYLDGENLHPFVPTDGGFTMVDDARIMQKYAGYGVEKTITKRYEAARQLFDTRITYDDDVVIVPYYHCGPGFTRSGNQYFGWTDTPRLSGTLDVASCPSSATFKGHGVGMSGTGAERLAAAGVKYDEILKWYYRGVEIQ